jgi:hypothetical protein
LASAEHPSLVHGSDAIRDEHHVRLFGELVTLSLAIGAITDRASGDTIPTGAVAVAQPAQDHGASYSDYPDVPINETFELIAAVDVRQDREELIHVAHRISAN